MKRNRFEMDAHNLIQVEKNPNIEEFGPGDTVRVDVRVVEGDRVRTQGYEGVVIRRRGSGQGKHLLLGESQIRLVLNVLF